MRLNVLTPHRGTGQKRLAVVGAIAFIVVTTFAGIKLSLIARTYLYASGAVGGLLIGLSLDDRDSKLVTAIEVVSLSVLVLFVAFVLDDLRIVHSYGVLPPLVRADPGSIAIRLLVFGFAEIIVLLAVGIVTLFTALAGTLVGAWLRPFVLEWSEQYRNES